MPAFRQAALPYRRRASPTNASFGVTKNNSLDHSEYNGPLTLRDENRPSASDPPLYHFTKRQDASSVDSQKTPWPPLSARSHHPPSPKPASRMPPAEHGAHKRPLPLRPLQLRVEGSSHVSRSSSMPTLPPPPGLWNAPGRKSPPRLTAIDPRMMAPIGSERRRKSEPDILMADPGDDFDLDENTTSILSFGLPAGAISALPPCSLPTGRMAMMKPRPLDAEQFRMLSAQHKSRYAHAPEMMSPLNPLRELAPPRFWETVPTRKLWNFKRPFQPSRLRNVFQGCDDYMIRYSKDVYVTNQHRHCRDCQKDTLHKRLLAYNNALDTQARTPTPRDIIIDLTRTLAAEYEAMDSDSDDDVAIITPTTPTLDLPVVDISDTTTLCDEWQSRIPASPRIVDLDSFDEEDTHSLY